MAGGMGNGGIPNDGVRPLESTKDGEAILEAIQLKLILSGEDVFRYAYDPAGIRRDDPFWDQAFKLEFQRWMKTGILPDKVLRLHSELFKQAAE